MQQIELSPAGRDFLVKLCGMLASDYDGERASAAMKVSSFLRDRALTGNKVIPEPPAGRPVQYTSPPKPGQIVPGRPVAGDRLAGGFGHVPA
jgi:hypothetical protein